MLLTTSSRVTSTMNHCDHHRPLYGRKSEIACLQEIAASVLRKGDFVVDQPLQRSCCLCHVDCECTIPTESTSHSEEDNAVHSCDGLEISHHRNDVVGDGGEGGSHFVLVSGRPGSGKRTLVTTALRPCKCCNRKSRFLFVSDRFHSMKNSEDGCKSKSPNKTFIAITRAIQEVLHILSNPNNAELSHAIRQKLLSLLKNPENASELCEIMPTMKKWLQEVDPPDNVAPDLSSRVAPILPGVQLAALQTQVWFPILQNFLYAVINCVPLVLLLEDVQYADEASLLLVKSLLSKNKSELHQVQSDMGLLIVTTYSDGVGVFSSNSFLSFLASSNDTRATDWNSTVEWKPLVVTPNYYHSYNVHQIVLSDLTWDDVNQWVQECDGTIKRCSRKQREEITNIVFSRSNGNPLHIRYLLQFLEQDVKLQLEPIHKKQIPSELEGLYLSIFLKQDVSVQDFIQVASLLVQHTSNGGDVYLDVLEIAMNISCLDIVERATCLGLIECSLSQPFICFSRECLQKAAYHTIVDISSLSLAVGRRIWRSAILSQDKIEVLEEDLVARVLLSTKLLRNSIDLLTDIDERIYMSQLCFETGQKSTSMGDFYTSAKLFEFAILVLGSELWQRRDLYEASLELHTASAQAYCSIADYDNMNRMLDLIFDKALTFQDMLPAYLVMVYASGSQHKLLETFRVSSMVLQKLGEPVSANPGTITIITHLLRTKWSLQFKTDRFLCNLPIAEDASYLMVTQLLSFTMFIVYMNYPNLSLILVCRLIQSVLKHGVCGPSSVAFSCYAFVLCSTGNFKEGYRMGRLALQFVDQFESWRPRVHVLVYGYVNHWTCPFRSSMEPITHAQRASLLVGDLEIYAVTASFYLMTALSVGISLKVLEPTAQSFCRDLSVVGQKNQLLLVIPLWSLINDLQGGQAQMSLVGDIKNLASVLNHCIKEGNKYMTGNLYAYRTMWYYLIGDFEQALQMAKKSYEQRQISDHALMFFEGLAALSMAWTSNSWLRRRKSFAVGKKAAKRMKRWADRCPENFRNKQQLFEAEIAALNGKSAQALSLFNQSIAKAKHEAFVHEEAIAYERLGHYQRRLGNDPEAKTSYASARNAYEKWGASILVDRMDDLVASISS